MEDIVELQKQLAAAIAANQSLAADAQSLTASLGRMANERDNFRADLEAARGQIINLQQARAQQSRTADQLRKHHREEMDRTTKEHDDTMKRCFEVNKTEYEKLKAQLDEERAANAANKTLAQQKAAEAEELHKLLTKYDAQIQADRAAEAERQKRDRLAKILAEAEQLTKELGASNITSSD